MEYEEVNICEQLHEGEHLLGCPPSEGSIVWSGHQHIQHLVDQNLRMAIFCADNIMFR